MLESHHGTYDPASIARFFDEFGEREWTRLVESPAAEVKLHIHAEYLRRFIAPGTHVLDIGAGPGRFTQILAELGASVVVADISPGQLELNRRFASQYGFAHAVTQWRQADICDLTGVADETFDAVICYGGPLSYVFDRREIALRELCRVIKPDGYLLLSVMCLWGAIHEKLPGVMATDAAANARIVATGELRLGATDGTRHHCHLFRSEELRTLLDRTGWEVCAMSASNSLSTAWGDALQTIRADSARWTELLAMEAEACRAPGALDLGTHLIAVMRRPPG